MRPLFLLVCLFLSSIAVSQVKITTSSLPEETVNTEYSATIDTSGGSVPFVWSVSAGSLPSGLALVPSANTRSATLSGTPTTAATYDFSISVKGHGGSVSTVSCSVTIQPQSGQDPVVNLTWDAGARDIIGYNVYRSTTHGGPYTQINTALLASTNYTDLDVVGGTTYYYVATELNEQGEQSEYSNEANRQFPRIEPAARFCAGATNACVTTADSWL